MRYGFLWVLLPGIAMTLWSCTGHQDVIREIEAYKPPALYQATKDMQEPRTPLDTSLEDKAFLTQKEKLEAIQKDWEKTLAAPPKETSFFTPDPDRQKVLPMPSPMMGLLQTFYPAGFLWKMLKFSSPAGTQPSKMLKKHFSPPLKLTARHPSWMISSEAIPPLMPVS